MMLERPFGVEIECYAPFADEYENSVEMVREFLDDNNLMAWADLTTGDESLNYRGVEIKSPILKGANGFKALKRAMELLAKNDFWVDETCGFHVHHSAPEFVNSPDMVISLVKSWMENQELIDMMVAPWRVGNSHCDSWDESDYDELLENIEYGSFDSTRGSINVNSLMYIETIEIRQHEGTLDYKEASSWVKFGQAFINNIGQVSLGTNPSEEVFMQRIKVSKNAHRFISKKVERNKNRDSELY